MPSTTKKSTASGKEKVGSTKKRADVVLVQDALGVLYALPVGEAPGLRVSDKKAAQLLKASQRSSKALSAELEKFGFVKRLAKEELPNFRLLMQIEYHQEPMPIQGPRKKG